MQKTGADTLDAEGKMSFNVPTSATGSFPLQMSITVAATDANRQVIGAYGSAVLHSSSIYVAARDSGDSDWYWKQGKPRTLGILAVRPDGRRVANVRIGVIVIRRRTQLQAGGNGQYPSSAVAADTIVRSSVVSAESPVQYVFTPQSPGTYEVVFSGQDEQGRAFATSLGGQVVGPLWTPWSDNPVRLALQLDRDYLSVGDSVAVRFTSPFARAEAWVTVERETILAQVRRIVGTGETVVRLPVTEAFFPGAQVSVVLVDSGSVWRSDSLKHRIRAGYASVSVAESVQRLQLSVTPERQTWAPGDSARITVSVRDSKSRPARAQVTLWAGDEGILALSYYSPPDPVSQLHSNASTGLTFATNAATMGFRRRFLPASPDWARDEISLAKGLYADVQGLSMSEDFRGSGAMGGTAYGTAAGNSAIIVNTNPRSEFRSTAFYLASLVTDADGNTTARVKLPDNVTRYHLIAVAVSDGDSYDVAESTLTVTKPLIARASLPRFVREGDSLLAGAVINNNTGAQATARMSASAQGLRLVGDSAATRTLANGTASEVRFSWRTNARAGETASVRFAVGAGANADIVDSRIPVRAPFAPRYHAISGVARDSATIRLMLPGDIDPARSRLTLRVGTSPIPIIRAAYWQLEVYPYLCSEQLTSNGRVILSMLRMQRAGLIDSTVAPTAATLRARLQFAVDELSRRQNARGGIGYWTRSSWSSSWLSAYTGMLLQDARAFGFAVDTATIAGIVRFMQPDNDTTSTVAEEAFGTREQRRRMVAARLSGELAALQFLRRAGAASPEREDRLRREAPRMTWEDRVWLVDLLAGRPDKAAAREQLTRVWRDVETAGIRADIPDSLLETTGFPSHVRPVARLLHATLALDPDHAQLPALIERVVQQGRAQRSW
jgi:uncharacterized protein YfaS (alpha-2-macroglobulin family)